MATALRAFALVLGIAFSSFALASAVVESVTGTVRSGPSATSTSPVAIGQRIDPGTTVVTGPNSFVTLRFDDGQVMLLNDDTEFRIDEYAFSPKEPAKDRFKFDLLRGAVRSVTGLLTKRNPQAYQLHAPQVTIGIRGTDFMVALVNPAYLSVLDGTVAASNAAGTATFAVGASATVASATTLAVSIAATALPASVAATFNRMSSIALSASGTAAGAGANASASADKNPVSGFGSGTSIGIGAGVGGPGLGGPGTSRGAGPGAVPGAGPGAGPAFGGPIGPGAGFGKGPMGPGKP